MGHTQHGGVHVVLGQGLGASLGCASALEGQLDDDGVPGGAATACVSEGHGERLVLYQGRPPVSASK
jgi:hypothetical protein